MQTVVETGLGGDLTSTSGAVRNSSSPLFSVVVFWLSFSALHDISTSSIKIYGPPAPFH